MNDSTQVKKNIFRLIKLIKSKYTNKKTNIYKSFDRYYFDSEFYLMNSADLRNSKLDPYTHFVAHGYFEGRVARFFDAVWYNHVHNDVALTGIDAYSHYKKYGRAEGRQARYVSIIPEDSASERNNYPKWLLAHNAVLTDRPDSTTFKNLPKISIILTTYNSETSFLKAAIESVRKQSYENWELCIADDGSKKEDVALILLQYAKVDSRIKIILRGQNGHISEASNSALELATGEYVALLDHDDLLSADALDWVAAYINSHPQADVIFSDEDKIREDGSRFDPYFKPDFNYELFLAQNMISHLGVYRTRLVKELGGFRKGFEGAQDHDLAFRVLERSSFKNIIHIPRVLYHWRAAEGSTALSLQEKRYAPEAGRRVVEEHLSRVGAKANVIFADSRTGHYRVRYAISTSPLVSIIIPTRDRIDILKICINSIIAKTSYKNYEILIIDNGSIDPASLSYFESLKVQGIKIIRDETEFNFSYLNNLGVSLSNGTIMCLMNNDIEILTPDWLEEMLSFALRPDIGCVGARLWYPNKTLQHGGVILGIGGVAGHAHKALNINATGYFGRGVHHQSYSAVTAACLVVKKTLYEEVGGMDEALAVAFNDVDFCLKIRQKGYRNIWTPYAEMVHHESASRGAETTPSKQQRFTREVVLMKARWGDTLKSDPAYNPNLTIDNEDYSLAWPPRISR